jgi:WD40 repeat protein
VTILGSSRNNTEVFMRCRLLVLGIILIIPSILGTVWAGQPERPRTSWQEWEAKVLSFSPDGKTLLTSGKYGIRLREASTGAVRSLLTTDSQQFHGPAFSKDGRFLFAKVGSDRHKPVHVFDLKVWNVATGETHGTIPYLSENLNILTDDFAVSPDGTTLAVLDNSDRLPMQVKTSKQSFDRLPEFEVSYNDHPGLPRVKLWDVHRWLETGTLDGGSVMAFSPDGTTLATGDRDWKAPVTKVWDLTTGQLRSELAGSDHGMKPMAFSPDGKLLAIGGSGQQILWEPDSGKKWQVPVRLLGNQRPLFSPDGSLLFPNGLPRGNPMENSNQDFPSFAVSPLPPRRLELGDGQFVTTPLTYKEARLLVSPPAMRFAAFGLPDDLGRRNVVVRKLPGLEKLGNFVVTGLIEAGFSPDGRWLVTWTGTQEAAPDNSGARYVRQLQVLEPQTGQMVFTVPLPEPVWGDPRWKLSPDGRTLAVAYTIGTGSDPDILERPRTIDLWDISPR